MTEQCCMGGAVSRRLARRLSRAAASILPGASLVLLPKCPLCLAAWLTAATGIGFSATGATWARGMLTLFAVAAVVLPIMPIVRRTLARCPTVIGYLYAARQPITEACDCTAAPGRSDGGRRVEKEDGPFSREEMKKARRSVRAQLRTVRQPA